jgi:hypothetical protein
LILKCRAQIIKLFINRYFNFWFQVSGAEAHKTET